MKTVEEKKKREREKEEEKRREEERKEGEEEIEVRFLPFFVSSFGNFFLSLSLVNSHSPFSSLRSLSFYLSLSLSRLCFCEFYRTLWVKRRKKKRRKRRKRKKQN